MATCVNAHDRSQAARFLARRSHHALSAAVLAASAALPAHAAINTWIGSSGYWSLASNWSLGTTPANYDTVFLTQADAVNRTVTLNAFPTLSGFTIDATGTGLMALSQAVGLLDAGSGGEYIGYSGTGKYIQTAGTNYMTGPLRLGYNAGATGTYSLSGTGSLIGASIVYIGYKGSGTLVQTGGINSLGTSGILDIGFAAGSSGTYTLAGGKASASRVCVGGSTATAGGTGVLNISGTASFTATSTFKIWDTPGTAVNFSGGSLTVGTLDTSSNPARFNWTAGSLTVTNAGTTLGTQVLGTSTTLTPAQSLSVAGLFNLTTGTSFTLAGGSLTAAAITQSASPGTFAWTAGRLSVNSALDASYLGPSTTLTPAHRLAVATQLNIPSGTTVSLAGGSITAYGISSSGSLPWTSGTVNITGGGLSIGPNVLGDNLTLTPSHTLSVTGSNPLTIPAGTDVTVSGGAVTAGSLSISGGTLTLNGGSVKSTGALSIYGSGSYTLNGGSASAPSVDLGLVSGGGTLTVAGAGTLAISGALSINPSPSTALHLDGGTITADSVSGRLGWSTGTVNVTGTSGLSAGVLPTLATGQNLNVTRTLTVPTGTSLTVAGGALTAGTFTVAGGAATQTDGTNAIASQLYLGWNNPGANGTYSLSGGTLTAVNDYIGYGYGGTFIQSGGVHSTTASIQLAFTFDQPPLPSSRGLYLLSGGTVSTGTSLYTDAGGNGSFIQSGGTVTVTRGLWIGTVEGSTGTYALSAGSLTVGTDDYVGYAGVGTFVQTGGTHPSRALFIGYFSGSSGAYNISGGSASFAANVNVGGTGLAPGGAGNLVVSSAASFSTAGALKIWNTPNTSVSLSGGTLSLASLDTSGNPARFSWTGGTLSFTAAPPGISPTGPLGPSVKLSPGMTLRTTALPAIDLTSSLDIAGGAFVVAYIGSAPADSLRSLLLAGRIFSSAADATHRLGYLDTGSSLTTLLTFAGDANLDGKLSADDYALLDRSYAKSLASARWSDGDFNYDGQITSADYLVLDATYLQQQGGTPSPDFLSQRESQFGAGYVSSLIASVPEPSSLLAAGGLAFPFLSRRRHRHPAG